MPEEIRAQVPAFAEVREIYQSPEVTTTYELSAGTTDEAGLIRFLCEERRFSEKRVTAAVERMRKGALLF
jgi:flap endonuclease-1